jgi:hypothetical protein
MRNIIAYVVFALGALSTDINLLIVDKCARCRTQFDRRCTSTNSKKKPIALHASDGINHEFCKTCLLKVMNKNPIRCPFCHYILSLQENNQLQKKMLKSSNAAFCSKLCKYFCLASFVYFVLIKSMLFLFDIIVDTELNLFDVSVENN